MVLRISTLLHPSTLPKRKLSSWLVAVMSVLLLTQLPAQTNLPIGNDAGAVIAGTLDAKIWSINVNTGKATHITTSPYTLGGVNGLAIDVTNGLIYYVNQNSSDRKLYAYDYVNNTHLIVSNFFIFTTSIQGLGKGAAAFYNGKLYLGVENVNPSPIPNAVVADVIYEITFMPASNGRVVNSIVPYSGYPVSNDWGDFIIAQSGMMYNNLYQKFVASDFQTKTDIITYNKTYFGQLAETNNLTCWNVDEYVQQINDDITNPNFGTLIGQPKTITLDGINQWDVPSTTFDVGQDAIDATGPVPATNTIGDYVWSDTDGDGIQDANEIGVPNAELTIWDDLNGDGIITPGIDRLLATTTTDNTGHYLFTNILPGDYIVQFTNVSSIFNAPIITYGSVPHSVTAHGIGGTYLQADFGVLELISLPITLTKFTASEKDCNVVVKWETEEEKNVKNFTVERSTNGEQFSPIHVIGSKRDSQSNTYQITDVAVAEKLFYRLRIQEDNGYVHYSDMRTVQLGCNKATAIRLIYPNPVKEELQIQISSIDELRTEVVIRDIQQRVVQIIPHTFQKGINMLTVNVATLAAGSYTVGILNEDATLIDTKVFVKN
ncbi:MAG: hypothetical protein KA974_03775 [Saprospiraceae bacterium]|nr:hypothetical protein [Saprospiraceae bacterium]MBP7699463.1 hypothetical protein [Saprospiraceae bacterium]